MDRGQSGRDDVFRRRDPFPGFVGFGPHRSLISGFFGGRDPFDDPFFTRPFGGQMMGDHDMFGPSPLGPMGGPFVDMRSDGFIEQAPPRGNSRRPVITEVDEDEGENAEHGNEQPNQDSYVQEPDDGSDGTEGGQVKLRRDLNRANSGGQPQARTFTYQSSSVTYGGINGAYYTASKTRRTGSDGITVEESKEADTTTKEATHRISRGIHDKGHSLTRKLNSDGKVDTTQTLHNLDEDELAGFEESWKGNAGHYLPGWNQNAGAPSSDNSGWSSASHVDPSRSNVALLPRPPSLTLSSPPVGVPQVTVAPMDVTGDRPGAGRFLGPSKAVIQGATESQNHGSSQSPEEGTRYSMDGV